MTEREAYEAGWRASSRASSLDTALDNFTNRHGGERVVEWEHGYFDYAAGRPKWSGLNQTGATR